MSIADRSFARGSLIVLKGNNKADVDARLERISRENAALYAKDVGGAAVPPEVPLGNAAKILILLATLGSFGVGVAGALVRERVDHTVRDAKQVTKGFGLNILGALPHLLADSSDGSAQAVDALRGIRMHVMHTYGSAGPIILTVSSPGIGDGKSFVATNLALAFADAGFSTLLVDGQSFGDNSGSEEKNKGAGDSGDGEWEYSSRK